MKKITLWAVGIALFLLLALLVYLLAFNNRASLKTFGNFNYQEINTTTKKEIEKDGIKFTCEVHLSYPKILSVKDHPSQDPLNRELKNRLQQSAASFEANVSSWINDLDAANFKAGSDYPRSFTFDAGYEILRMDGEIISLLINETAYFAGAAHPNHVMYSFNYNVAAGQLFKLSDLFQADPNCLAYISNYCIEALKRELSPDNYDIDWASKGAGPNFENFSAFCLSQDKIIFNFQEYQVSCYAAGQPRVCIPFSEIKPYLSSEYSFLVTR